jgi:tartrate dehydrogenase/decarboxylase / D-malate dehydrogenase
LGIHVTDHVPSYRLAIWPGDGIGKEVVAQALRVLCAAQEQHCTFELRFEDMPWGSDYWHLHGKITTDEFIAQLQPFDAILLGALGDPGRLPDHVTLAPLLKIRQGFDQYACVRPARLINGVTSPLRSSASQEIDLVVIRENSEGEYVSNGGRIRVGTPQECAIESAYHSRFGVERILRFGFETARKRRRHLTMITKSNALKYGLVMWDEILDELAPQFEDVQVQKMHVDAAAMSFVRSPNTFDVVVASNLFGDILSDLAASLVGGLGLAPSANINPERKYPSLFEPVHGSAPDIAGKGKANPVATILSAAMMLDWLTLSGPAASIIAAVEAVLGRKEGTPDLGGRQSTSSFTDLVIQQMIETGV